MATDGLIAAPGRLGAAAARAGRDPGEVKLVVVVKGQPDEAVLELYESGHRVFAENRADALEQRQQALPADIEWHFVGSVQRRKAKAIAPRVVLLHSMDRERLETTWAALEQRPPVLLQVNVAGEEQKHGYAPEAIPDAADRLGSLDVRVLGLMVLPPAPRVPQDSRPWFERLAALGAEIRSRHPDAVELSMGMTDDFEVAVECGATIVRLGRTIFGVQEY